MRTELRPVKPEHERDPLSAHSREDRRRLLLLSADWQTRALTLAELKEQGYEVLALPGFTWGMKAILRNLVEPPLVIVDTKDDSDVTPERVRQLKRLLPGVPLVLVVGTFEQGRFEPLRGEVDAFLVRPLTVGQVVRTVMRLLPPPKPTPATDGC